MASAEEKSGKALENTIAMELLNKINQIEYTQVIPKLNYCDAVRKPDFEAHPSSKKFRQDTRDCYLHIIICSRFLENTPVIARNWLGKH